jgi:antitoxin PrlF
MAYTLTSKSQVTLPKAIREHLQVAPGSAVDFKIGADGSVRVASALKANKAHTSALGAARKRFTALRGIGGHAGATDTDALMQLLRGYAEDDKDPGFTPKPRKVARSK